MTKQELEAKILAMKQLMASQTETPTETETPIPIQINRSGDPQNPDAIDIITAGEGSTMSWKPREQPTWDIKKRKLGEYIDPMEMYKEVQAYHMSKFDPVKGRKFDPIPLPPVEVDVPTPEDNTMPERPDDQPNPVPERGGKGGGIVPEGDKTLPQGGGRDMTQMDAKPQQGVSTTPYGSPATETPVWSPEHEQAFQEAVVYRMMTDPQFESITVDDLPIEILSGGIQAVAPATIRMIQALTKAGVNVGKEQIPAIMKNVARSLEPQGVTAEGVPMPIPTPNLIDQTLYNAYKAGNESGEARRKMEELALKNAEFEKLKKSSLVEQDKEKLARIKKNNETKQKEWEQDLGEPVDIKYDFPTEEDTDILLKYPKDRTGEKGLYKIIGNTEPKWNTVKDLDLGLDKINPEADNILNSIASKEPVLVDGAYNSLITKLPSGVDYPTVQTHYVMGHKGIPFTVVDHYGFAADRGWKHASGITNDAFIVGNGFTKATVYGNHLAIMGKDVGDIKAMQLFLTKPPKVK